MTAISTHVLDLESGRPAAGIAVALDGGEPTATDGDGRAQLGDTGPGTHALTFGVSGSFFPEVTVTFTVRDEPKLHVPLLLSPYGYSVYRGS